MNLDDGSIASVILNGLCCAGCLELLCIHHDEYIVSHYNKQLVVHKSNVKEYKMLVMEYKVAVALSKGTATFIVGLYIAWTAYYIILRHL